ncbi:hypothetical protein [Methylobacterium pseudosasicola]|uniref:PEP-CTERM protein-sorting domain-containing protein n=1 Tax=Methylobacterium pseudosasicola TaxID=582667 RepID=A0A1I4G9W4_9HYPH|nr:hypothetical protein [Methylobacterium pseudosasicola]SFL26087.1 PEP-CTERM protein-sorting domain-containing protein [Methylobacterium pseudosasicola]
MKERLSRAAVVAALCLFGQISSAQAEPVDLIRDFVCQPLESRDGGAAPPTSASGLTRSRRFASLDALLGGDAFARTVTCFGGGSTFPGLLSPPSIDSATAGASYVVKSAASGGAGGGSGGGGHTVTGPVAAASYGADGAFAGLFSLDAGSGGHSGGAPAPEINAVLGLALAGGTVAFLRRRRRAPAAA